MGWEAMGAVRLGDAAGRARVLLETGELIFRGEVKGRVPFRVLTAIEPGQDGLRLGWPDGEGLIGLSAAEAARWADRIANPPSLLDKLGVKEGTTVVVIDPHRELAGDAAFAAELAGRAVKVKRPARPTSAIWRWPRPPTWLASRR